jgi:hypothetical protein
MVLVHGNGDVRVELGCGEHEVAACTITGLSVSFAASMIAWICSMLLTLNAARP